MGKSWEYTLIRGLPHILRYPYVARCPSLHAYSHTQRFPRVFCVNAELESADGSFEVRN